MKNRSQTARSAGGILEAVAVYMVLFFPGILTSADCPESIPFSLSREGIRLGAYTIPGLLLIGFLTHKRRPEEGLIPRFSPSDLKTLGLSLPGLLLIAAGVSVLADVTAPQGIRAPKVEAPDSGGGWLIMLLSCAGTGYLEESYFRRYLPWMLEDSGLSRIGSVLVSAALFSCCHRYEGLWGMVNAGLAAGGLSLVFMKYQALHGIALAHGGYNGAVYILSRFGE
jgi:membrane protease YdiL (CAAX protease family)